MAAYINRSASLMSGDGPHNRALVDGSVRLSPDNSPLQVFVRAKRKINEIFLEVEDYVRDAVQFMQSLDGDVSIVHPSQVEQAAGHVYKVRGIRDVLARDHMKVAFFGRTSNGKSTVINAMLRDKILPSGIGHTTNCFLQVEGSDGHEAYLVTEASQEKQNVKSVGQLAHALCKEKLCESELVRIFWPRDRCALLRDDVVFVDSPGIDVTPNLDEWIDRHCLDADVFVLVCNAESTLMVTEKNFFHKVSEKLSKPNLFILNNRWDASANEPEFLEEVRRQHQERGADFLSRELKVCSPREADDRIFFVSAKEALQTRLAERGAATTPTGTPAEGFQTRLFEFQDFERRFEECISQAAVRTKFEQHAQRGRAITADLRSALDGVLEASAGKRESCEVRRRGLRERLDRTEQQLILVTHEMKDKIRNTVEDVEQRVSRALSDEIRRLHVLVDEFNVPFHPEPLVLNVYKRELHAHVEQGLGSNLRARLSTALAFDMERRQREMAERVSQLLPPASEPQEVAVPQEAALAVATPRCRPFEVLYRLNCDNLCADFQEDLEFRFSWGVTSLLRRLVGPKTLPARKQNGSPPPSMDSGIVDIPLLSMPAQPPILMGSDDWSLVSRFALASVGQQGTVGGLFVAGFLLKTVGWRLVLAAGAVYSCLYLYERLTWTNKARERLLKRQYVSHATKKLRMIVDLTSANCSHQVQQELSGTFARLCQLVDEATANMNTDLQALDKAVRVLDEATTAAKVLRNKASYLSHELELFEDAYLR